MFISSWQENVQKSLQEKLLIVCKTGTYIDEDNLIQKRFLDASLGFGPTVD